MNPASASISGLRRRAQAMGKYGTMRKHHKISGRPSSIAHRMPPRAGLCGAACRNFSDIGATFPLLLTASMFAVMGAGMT